MKDKNSNVLFFVRSLIIFVIIATFLLLIMRFGASRIRVEGMSMYPTLWDGESVIINKVAYKNKDPERYDIVIFGSAIAETGFFIKRIYGLPGETIQIDKDGNIYVDDQLIDDPYAFEAMEDAGRAANPIKLGEDEYFCLGDNRNHSEDSRFAIVGNVEKDKILGRVRIRILPISKYGYIDLYRKGQD